MERAEFFTKVAKETDSMEPIQVAAALTRAIMDLNLQPYQQLFVLNSIRATKAASAILESEKNGGK